MSWTEERHGTDKGYRSRFAYVGRSPKKFWRVWLLERGHVYRLAEPVFTDDKQARQWAESEGAA